MNKPAVSFLFVLILSYSGLLQAAEESEQLYQQALLKNQAGLLIDASVLLTDAISLDDQQAKYFYQRGLSFFGMGQVAHGLKDFNAAVDLKTKELGVYLHLIKHYQAKQQYLAVLVITDQLIANLPAQAAGAYHDKALAYEAMHKPKQALAAYQQVLNSMDATGAETSEFKQQTIAKMNHIKQQMERP